MQITEDEIYRSSSQFRLWSFTPDQLAAQRAETNKVAATRVKAAVQRQRAQRAKEGERSSVTGSESEINGSGVENGNGTVPEKEVDCLTVAEEQKLVNTFCERAIDLGNFFKFPIEVVATGVQFLKRFYLFNSPMTYEPQMISRSAMFIANKTENNHLTAEDYALRLTKTTVDQVLAPEYLIVQALRFTFDVRHPFRGLKGGHMEMLSMAQGKGVAPPTTGKTSSELQADMLHLPIKPGGPQYRMTPDALQSRITDSYIKASRILKTTAILSDAYFLYTPAQIWLSAHLIADEPLTTFYISTKFPSTSDPTYIKLLNTLRACVKLLQSHRSMSKEKLSTEDTKAAEAKEQAEVQQLIKKLRHCRDPDKIDLVGLNKAHKRDAVDNGALDENKAKRRKLQREEHDKDRDVFWGPDLPKK